MRLPTLSALALIGTLSCAGAPARVESAPAPSGVSPVRHGEAELARALAAAGSQARVRVALAGDSAAAPALARAGITLDPRAESFAIVSDPTETLVVGRDESGALYGALELAERLATDGAAALPLRAPVSASPLVPIRGANLFLVMPVPGETTWWFRDEGFWSAYLELLTRARMNFLDIHGMYNLANTNCPNALLYFATSATHPDVGAPAADREANIRMLGRVVAMAAERGIRVGLMSYRSDTSLDAERRGAKLDAAGLEVYTREAVRDIAERVPALWRLGFRIGESGHPASWYTGTFVEGLNQTRAQTGLSTRTWMTKKAEIMGLVRSTTRDTLVEAKYNGEQMGPPYPIAGGLMTHPESWFSSYSYQDYLDPPAPYTFVFHIWAGGTNRVFRYASYDRIRRTVPTTLLGSASGFSMMPTHAFYPQFDFWHRDARDRFSPWAFRRDELEYLLFGRLGYDPGTPERTFREALRRRVGTDALWEPMQAATEIPAWITTANSCGPDQRQSAPELEWGGSLRFWAGPTSPPGVRAFCHTNYHGPLDQFAIASPHEAARDLALGRGTSRLGPLEVARVVLDDARRAHAAASVTIDPGNAEARDVARETIALGHLGEYFGHKMRAAAAFAVFERSGRPDYLAEARSEIAVAHRAWATLGKHCEYIAPFAEGMRMGGRLGFNPAYHWTMQRLDEDLSVLDEAATRVRPAPSAGALPPAKVWMDTPRGAGPGLAALDVTVPEGGRFRVQVKFAAPVPAGAAVRVLHKGFSGLEDWEAIEAKGAGVSFGADVERTETGGFFAVEVVGGPGVGWRYPDAVRETPYRVVAPGR